MFSGELALAKLEAPPKVDACEFADCWLQDPLLSFSFWHLNTRYYLHWLLITMRGNSIVAERPETMDMTCW